MNRQKYFSKKEFLNHDFRSKDFTAAFWQILGNKQWAQRRQIFMKSISNELNSNNLIQTTQNLMKRHVFPVIDEKCHNNEKWDIRK